MFMKITKLNILISGRFEKSEFNKPLTMIPNKIATKKFEAGPARAISGSDMLLFLKLYGLYGTGLAQPIIKPVPVRYKNSGRTIEPNKSRCFIGFNVSLPSYCAVLSPK